MEWHLSLKYLATLHKDGPEGHTKPEIDGHDVNDNAVQGSADMDKGRKRFSQAELRK